MTRAATSPELTLYRTPGKWSKLQAVILDQPIVYRARINQTFATLDQVIDILYDGGVGDLSAVLPDMEVWIGSSLDAYDKGICRLRDKDATHFYLSETSEIQFADNDYVTILANFGVWARPVRIAGDGTVYMDEVTYSDQHTNWDPQPNMGTDRVLELTDVTVETTFHAGDSFCPGSSIASYAWSCATASATSDPSLADFTVQFDTGGTHLVYLTATADNGKSFFGIRNVFVVDDDHPAFSAVISNPGKCDVESGGWEIELTLFGGVDLADAHERAKIILFSEDHYGGTTQAIGPVVGSENIWFIGWISKESNHLSAEQGSVTFTANGAAFWMKQIPSWPDGVELASGALDWTKISGLTVDLGVYHFLRWRSTITRVMDVTLTGDTRLSPEVSSSAQDLWSQLQEMTWNQIYARPGVNILNQLSIQIHPSLIPTASRAYPTVMAITKPDYQDGLDFDRAIIDDVGIVDMSGVQATAPGRGSAYFALAPGHSLPHYGAWDLQPNLLLESQAQVITLAGLYRSWRNNPFKNIPIVFDAPIRLIDCFPNQRCTINITTADNIRGWSYNGGLIPTSVQLVQNPATGYCHTEVTFEAQTSESQSRVGDTPGSGDTSGPVTPSLPPMPPIPIIIPGGLAPSGHSGGPPKVILHDTTYGLLYTENFDVSSPNWVTINAGLDTAADQHKRINFIAVCPNGALYVAYIPQSTPNNAFIARAPSIGAAFTVLYDCTDPALNLGNTDFQIWSCAINPLVSESFGFIMGTQSSRKFYLGAGGTYATGATVAADFRIGAGASALSYGMGAWIATSHEKAQKIAGNGASILANITFATPMGSFNHMRAGTLDIQYMQVGDDLYKFTNSMATQILVSTNTGLNFFSSFFNDPNTCDCDPSGLYIMGRVFAGAKGKSSDGGATFLTLGSLPPGTWWFQWAGLTDETVSGSRWIAAGGSSVRYSPDFGTSWLNREGDLLTVAPLPTINMIKVVDYG